MLNIFLAVHMSNVQEHLFQCVTLMWNLDIRSNITDLICNTIAEAWDYGQQTYNTWTCFTGSVQIYIVVILEANCDLYTLLARQLCHESKRAQCTMTQVACVHSDWPAKGFVAVLQPPCISETLPPLVLSCHSVISTYRSPGMWWTYIKFL
jgi:hypothetical protein